MTSTSKQGSCVYPHPDLPLFPRLLVPAMGSRTVVVDGLGEKTLASFVEPMAPGTLPALRKRCAIAIATVVQSILTRRLSESAWADLRVAVPARVRMTDLRLLDRARVSLQSWPLFDVASPWRNASLRDLLRQQRGDRSMGARLLMGFLLAAQDAEDRLTEPTAVVRLEPQCLEDELRFLTLEAVHSARVAGIYLTVRGWDGRGPKRVSAVARDVGLTHERVRQIVVQAEASMGRRRGLPVRTRYLQQALALVTQAAPLTGAEAAQALKDQALSREVFDVRGLIDAAKYFGIPCAIEADDNGEGIYGLGERLLVDEIRKHIRRAARSRCVVETRDIRERYSADCESSTRLVNFAMLGIAGARLIGAGNWLVVGGDDWDETRARDDCRSLRICQSIARMAAYFGKVTPHQVLTAISRMRARPHDLVTRDLIVELALYCGWSVSAPAERGERGERGESRDEVIEITPEERSALRAELDGSVEAAMARILERQDGSMKLPDFSEACLDAGINANTYQAYLRNSVLFGVQSQSRCALTTYEDASDFLCDRDLVLGIAAAAAPRRPEPASQALTTISPDPGAWS